MRAQGTDRQLYRGNGAEDAEGGPDRIGILEWFEFGDARAVEAVLDDLRQLGVRQLRTGVSWADWHRPDAASWFDWYLPRLAQEVTLLPCLLYTPPSLGVAPRTSSPPREPSQYAEWLAQMIERYGEHFGWVELWNEPNNLSEWDWRLDPGWCRFAEMVTPAARWAQSQGKKVALGGMSPVDPDWLRLMFDLGVMEHVDAVGVHGFPNWSAGHWEGWERCLEPVRDVLARKNCPAQVWITEAGYSTWRLDEHAQLRALVEAVDAGADRLYWYSARDLSPERATVDGFHLDEREYHFGLKTAGGRPKLLSRLWTEEGLEGVRAAAQMPRFRRTRGLRGRAVLITGGAGFVGANLADRLLSQGRQVIVYDNLSRPGVERNLRWLTRRYPGAVQAEVADIRDQASLGQAMRQVDQVFHFAAQVAVTTSLEDPGLDFEVNARGTLCVLEEMRKLDDPPTLVFTSTNKVYGALHTLELNRNGSRYEPADATVRRHGVDESFPLEFRSPYGCSKGAADQYVADYSRSFGLPAVVLRMSCIYGPLQQGTEDQGWVAHFVRSAVLGQDITIFGDGLQVRDLLFVDDLVGALLLAQAAAHRFPGAAFNIGGGPGNAVSLVDVLGLLTDLTGRRPRVIHSDWRMGDQRYYVSDTRRFGSATGWVPTVPVREGVERLYRWMVDASPATSVSPHASVPAQGAAR